MTRNRLLTTAGLCALMTTLAACGSSREPTGGEVASKGRWKPYRSYIVGVPYTIKGIRYYPKEDMSYAETGVASWYGPGFHGKRTANGEEYNQDAMTAAHRTLPMPSIVKVTRLDNGRSIVVRINDRGPFADDRIIDLSREGARRLGMLRRGTARVRVTLLRRETEAMKRNGQVYANMAALNRRYVDGRGSGQVIQERRQEAEPPQQAYRQQPPASETNLSGTRPTVRPVQPEPDAAPATTGAANGSSGDGSANGGIRSTALRAPLRIAPSETTPRRPLRQENGAGDARDNGDRGDRGDHGDDRAEYRSEDRTAYRTENRAEGRATYRPERRADTEDRSEDRRARTAAPASRERRVGARPTVRPKRYDTAVRKPLRQPPPAAGRIWVRAAAYTEKSRAERIRGKLGRLGGTRITPVQIRRTVFYRVEVGPVRSTREGDRLLARVVRMGYKNARVVITPANP